jgi:RNA polymerase sigma-70 factor (ECF subfamily)
MINWLRKFVVKRVPEEQLIHKIQNGDKEAFGNLYLTYLDRIYRYVFFRVNQDKHTAEDLTEIIFIKAMQHIKKFEQEKGTFQSWLYRISHNTVLDHYKTYKATTHMQENTVAIEVIEKLEDELDTKQKIAKVMEEMKSLTPEQRNIIILRFIEGLSHREIAFITNKKEDAIRAIQYRGLQKLKKRVRL